MTEVFTYDELNRLFTSQVEDEDMYTINYSNNGNIISRTDVGSYSYSSSQKNAVTGITNNPGTITEPDSIEYTHSNMTSSVSVSDYEIDFSYNPDDQRIKSVLKYQGTPQKTKYYFGSYEKEVTGTGTKHLHYIYSPYGLVAVLIKEGESTTTYYTETDHLGSIIGLMNSSGTYAEQFSYDPWGRRRNPMNWTFNNVPNPALLDRGFTGHEHLDKLGLINMNGRMYDPILGRFLGVDPVIQMPDNSQSFNGYSYCLNNPLIYTDPSGYSYFQYMKDLYNGTGHFYYRGGDYWNGDDGWQYYQPTLGGGSAPAANISYDAMHQDPYHIDSKGNLTDNNGNVVLYGSQLDGAKGDKRYGHYIRETVEQNGGIHGNSLNDEGNPNQVDNVQITYKWVWDVAGTEGIDYVVGPNGSLYGLEPYNGPKYITGMAPSLGIGKIVKGASIIRKTVVIGENMPQRVISYAKKYGFSWFKPTGTNPQYFMRNQAQWIRRQILDPGVRIIDIGPDPARTLRSPYYLKELEMLIKYLGL